MKDERIYLHHILECISDIEAYVGGGRAEFFESKKTQAAVLHTLQVMAESTLRLTEVSKSAYPEVGWEHIRNFRNRLVHDYLSIDLEIVWRVVERNVPPLKQAVLAMLAATQDETRGAP